MKKSTKKRGRPVIIKPYIGAFIKSKVEGEKRKPEAERMPRKVLAHEVQKKLKQLGVQNLPKLSTLEKRISAYSKDTGSEQDKPWSVSAMATYDIPPETLPIILKVWSQIMEKAPKLVAQAMTIRIARWIGRLYYVFKEQMPVDMKEIPEDERTKVDSWLPGIYLYALIYAHFEQVIELLGGYPSTYNDTAVIWIGDAQLAGNEELERKLEESVLGLSADHKLLSRMVEILHPALNLWGDVMMRGRRGGKKAASQGKRPGHGAKLPNTNGR